MKQVFIRQGQAVTEEVPAPQLEPDVVLIQSSFSCVSIGTESQGLATSAEPLWKRALKNPQKIPKAINLAASKGLAYTHKVATGQHQLGTTIGYSLAGRVLAVGDHITGVQVGDRVACAGAQFAYHAEIVRVAPNLLVPLPDQIDLMDASTVALGAIALQGVRRAEPTLGETFVVIGLGFIGQLTVQMLRANGCHTIGIDLDPARVQLALDSGMELALRPDDNQINQQVFRLTAGIGADGVIITASTPSHEVVSTAFQMCRRKGRVVLVGDVGLNLNRADFYAKELDFLISTSYGPGRYDAAYEEQGLEYPVSYVRWTENRNMGAYLQMIADGKITIKPMLEHIYSVDRASEGYALLRQSEARPLLLLLEYPDSGTERARTAVIHHAQPRENGKIHIAIVGAGGFATGTHLPNLKTLADRYQLRAVMSRTGHNAESVARNVNANYATTDFAELLRDDELDAILIATRHNLHAEQTLQALKAGKHVFVEKPLAVTEAELKQIASFFHNRSTSPVLLTGFNRRFSVHARRIKELVKERTAPMVINYRMNAGYLPLDHWTQTEEGAGRNIGEACHIYDLFVYLTDAKAIRIDAHAIKMTPTYYTPRDNFIASLTFEDGSVASLVYTALGAKDYPKEQMDVFVDGKVITLDNYHSVDVAGDIRANTQTKTIDKGHLEEMIAFADTLKKHGEWAIPLWQQLHAMEIAFAVERELGR